MLDRLPRVAARRSAVDGSFAAQPWDTDRSLFFLKHLDHGDLNAWLDCHLKSVALSQGLSHKVTDGLFFGPKAAQCG